MAPDFSGSVLQSYAQNPEWPVLCRPQATPCGHRLACGSDSFYVGLRVDWALSHRAYPSGLRNIASCRGFLFLGKSATGCGPGDYFCLVGRK